MPAHNLDQLLLHRFAAEGGAPVPIDTNPVTADLGCELHAIDREQKSVRLRFLPAERHLQGNGVVAGEVEVRGRVERLGARLAFTSATLGRVGVSHHILASASSVMAVIR